MTPQQFQSANADYLAFLGNKIERADSIGLEQMPEFNANMFPYQQDVLAHHLGVGRAAAFLDTGLGKSIIELEFGRIVAEHTNKPVLMFAPLAVGPQHVREAAKFGIDNVRTVRVPDEIRPGVNIVNYERMHHFSPEGLGGIILDESSILKSFTGKTTRALMAFAESIPFRLAATATPAPNDHMELGQHSQFLGAMASNEMLARWFIADQAEMGRYRLKRYGVRSFWAWVASWARMLSKPSDLGYSDDGFILPGLCEQVHHVEHDITSDVDGELFRLPDTSATKIHAEKRLTAVDRAEKVAEIASGMPNEPIVIWVETDYDADAVRRALPEAMEVRGSMSADEKEARLVSFSLGNERVLLTKPKIAGFGLNWQHCAHTIFGGLSFSYEQYYQAVRRFYRFGQTREVNAHIVMGWAEAAAWKIVQRKATEHRQMKQAMQQAMREACEVRAVKLNYQPDVPVQLPKWMEAS